MLVVGLVGAAFYVGLLTSRRVNPPAVPVSSGDRIPGHQVGEAGLLRAPNGSVALHDVLAVRGHGKVRLGVVRSFGAREGAPTYVLGGTGEPRLEVTDAEIVGKVDRWVPAAGWLLLVLRERPAQLVLGAVVVALFGMLITGRGLPLDAHAPWPLLGEGGPSPSARGPCPVLCHPSCPRGPR